MLLLCQVQAERGKETLRAIQGHPGRVEVEAVEIREQWKPAGQTEPIHESERAKAELKRSDLTQGGDYLID